MHNRTFFYTIFLSLVSPFMALASALFDKGLAGYRRLLLVILIVIYGSTLPFSEKSDAFRHQQSVYDFYLNMSWTQFVDEVAQILSFKVGASSTDLYRHLISYLSGSVLGMPGLFFLFVSLVYGYFFSGAVLRVFKDFEQADRNFVLWVFALLFLLTKNVEGILTVRTWTGLWILFYGSLKYYETRQVKYLWLLVLPPLIHFGYLIMALPAYVVLITGSHPRVFAVIFVLSAFFNLINPEIATSNLTLFELGEQKVNQYYTGERQSASEKLESFTEEYEDRTWYKQMYVSGYFDYGTNFLVYLLILFGIYPRLMNGLEKHLFSIGLLMLAGSNIFFFIWAASNRMKLIGLVFVLAAFVMLLQRGTVFSDYCRQHLAFRNLVKLSAIAVLPKFIYHISFFLNQLSVFFFVGPFIPWIDKKMNMSTLEFIKSFF